MQKRLVILSICFTALFGLSLTAIAQEVINVNLAGRQSAEIKCDGRRLKLDRKSETKVIAECKPNEGVPAATPTPTNQDMTNVQLSGGQRAEINCEGRRLKLDRKSETKVIAECKPGEAVPTATPSSPPASILWSADHETGDLSQWDKDEGGGVFNTGTGQVIVTNTVAHSGRYAIAMTINDANKQTQAARIFRWGENPKEAYYSAWFFFPQIFKPEEWWIVFQFKSGDPMWLLNIENRENGDMVFYLWDWINKQGYDNQMTSQITTVPIGRWVHVEAFYRRATDKTGRITIWQDGVKLYDFDGVQTATSDSVHWSLANYTDQITPSTATIYADDAVISTNPVSGAN